MLPVREWWVTDSYEMKVSRHAVRQFMERAGAKSDKGVEERLLEWFEKGEPVRRVGFAHIGALARHGATDYRRYGGWIVVAQQDTIITVYHATRDKWMPK